MTPMTRSEVLDMVAQARASNYRPNLRGADLRYAYLEGVDLQGVGLRGTDGKPEGERIRAEARNG